MSVSIYPQMITTSVTDQLGGGFKLDGVRSKLQPF